MAKAHPRGSNPHYGRDEEDKMQLRRIAIFDAGADAAKSGTIPSTPMFGGFALGSMERVIFFNGVLSVDPSFQHPYGPGCANPRRPEPADGR